MSTFFISPWTLESELALLLTEVCSLNLEASHSLCILHNVLLSVAFQNLNELSGYSFHSFLFLIWNCVMLLWLFIPLIKASSISHYFKQKWRTNFAWYDLKASYLSIGVEICQRSSGNIVMLEQQRQWKSILESPLFQDGVHSVEVSQELPLPLISWLLQYGLIGLHLKFCHFGEKSIYPHGQHNREILKK